ncbi:MULTISPECIES: hypothetical protein [Deinococcus]|uniref:Lipoprotein n=1 Tax=Deinococcus rufus TaxID=2136097 RepID=A0ABV7ZCT5_9DEIO|nr:hypothetical protein [Deinococcus sp. AB2017081]WQE94036.1 hypothetical protein U2P90_11515 [Deinococcus sp. AB2017081]
MKRTRNWKWMGLGSVLVALCTACAPGATAGQDDAIYRMRGNVAPEAMPLTVHVDGVGTVQAVKDGGQVDYFGERLQPFELNLPAPRGPSRPLSSLWARDCRVTLSVDPSIVQILPVAQGVNGVAYSGQNLLETPPFRMWRTLPARANRASLSLLYVTHDALVNGEAACPVASGGLRTQVITFHFRAGWNITWWGPGRVSTDWERKVVWLPDAD